MFCQFLLTSTCSGKLAMGVDLPLTKCISYLHCNMSLFFHPLVISPRPLLTLSLISVSWGWVLSDHILMMGEAENPFCISCALGSQNHKGFLQALLIISFYTLKEKIKCWWQMASFITFNWLTVLLSLWNTHFGPKHWKKNMPFTLVCCQLTLKECSRGAC